METGITKKSGNADGEKVSTAGDRERGNIRYTTGVGKTDDKRLNANRVEGA